MMGTLRSLSLYPSLPVLCLLCEDDWGRVRGNGGKAKLPYYSSWSVYKYLTSIVFSSQMFMWTRINTKVTCALKFELRPSGKRLPEYLPFLTDQSEIAQAVLKLLRPLSCCLATSLAKTREHSQCS